MSESHCVIILIAELIPDFAEGHLIPSLPSCARGVLRGVNKSWRDLVLHSETRVVVNNPIKWACWVAELLVSLPAGFKPGNLPKISEILGADLYARYNQLLDYHGLPAVDYKSTIFTGTILASHGLANCKFARVLSARNDYDLDMYSHAYRHTLHKHPDVFVSDPASRCFPCYISTADFIRAIGLIYSVCSDDCCPGGDTPCNRQIAEVVLVHYEVYKISHLCDYFPEETACSAMTEDNVSIRCMPLSAFLRPGIFSKLLEITSGKKT